MSGSPVWLVGVGLAVVSAIISNLGLNLQKRNHLNNSQSAAEKHKAHRAAGKRRPSSSLHKHDRDGHHSAAASTAGSQQQQQQRDRADKVGRKNRVQPSDILIRHSSSGSNAAESGGEEQTAKKRRRRRKKKWSGVGSGEQLLAEKAPLMEAINGQAVNGGGVAHSGMNSRYSSLADDSGTVDNMQDLLSASSSFLVQPPPTNGTTASTNTTADSRHTASPSPVPSTVSSAHTHKNVDDAAASINYTRQLTWQCGLALVILGSLFDFAALAFASQSLIAPLGSLTLVSNVFLAPLLLKEKLSRRDVVCTLVIVVGAALAVSCASHDDSTQSVKAMFSNFLRIQFIAYAALVVLSVVGLRVITWKAAALRKRAHTNREAAKRYQAGMKYHRFGYAAAAGIMGAQSVLFAKCTSTLFRTMIAGDGVMFVYPGTYGVLLGLGVTIFFQIRWLNSGLRLFPALYVVPVFQSFWILVSVVSGMVFFQEYHGVLDQPLQACGFCLGIFLTIGGVYVLSQKAGQDGPQDGTTEAAAAADVAEASLDKPAARRDSLSSSSSFEPYMHPRSRSMSGDSADFIVQIDQAHTPGSALKQPLLVEHEEKQPTAAHSIHKTPIKSSKRTQASASPPSGPMGAASSSPAATKAPFMSSQPHHLSPLPEQLSPDSQQQQQRVRVDSDPTMRRRDAAVDDGAIGARRLHAQYPPVVQVEQTAVLPSHSFSHANEFLSAAPPASPPRRTRSASIGHIGDDWQLDSRRNNKKKAPNFNFQQALAALVSPPVQPLEASPHFRKRSWQEISRNAAMTAPGLSAFAHAFALRNYERNEGESPDDTEDTDDSLDSDNNNHHHTDNKQDDDDDDDDDQYTDDDDDDDEEGDDEDGEDEAEDEVKEREPSDASHLQHSVTAPASLSVSLAASSSSTRSSPRSALLQNHTVRVPSRRAG